ncbi:MAG: glycosyltransferase family 9 protein [Desulfobacteraceae bacterium]|nr:glycosyltransferase family 9 protein [Desulfobacteraceae bacterium]
MIQERSFAKGNGQSLDNHRNILLIQLGDIGDVVLSTPAIRALKQSFPKARLVVAVRDKAADLLIGCPWCDDVLPVRKAGGFWGELFGQIALVLRLRGAGFDLAIDLRTGTRGAILARISGAARRLGFWADSEPWWRNMLFTDLLRHDYRPEQHVIDYLLSLLEAYNVKVFNREPEIVVPEFARNEADILLKQIVSGGRSLVVLQPFSLWRYKELVKESYIELCRWLVRERNVVVVISGTSQERRQAAEIADIVGDGCYNFAGHTHLLLYAAMLMQSRLVIGVDSAGVHIASAVGSPTVSIFGPSSPASWGPKGNRHLVVQRRMPCVPCRMRGCNNSGISRCLEELPLEEVRAAIDRQLSLNCHHHS